MTNIIKYILIVISVATFAIPAHSENIFKQIGSGIKSGAEKVFDSAKDAVSSAKEKIEEKIEQAEEKREEKADIKECKKDAKDDKAECLKEAEDGAAKKDCEQDYKAAIAECEDKEPEDDDDDEDEIAQCKKDAKDDKDECMEDAEGSAEKNECEQDYKAAIAECEDKEPEDDDDDEIAQCKQDAKDDKDECMEDAEDDAEKNECEQDYKAAIAECEDKESGTDKNKSQNSVKAKSQKNTKAKSQKSAKAQLSEEDSQAKIDALQENADKMKEREQSTANKLLGAAAIGATGIGAKNMLEGKAEQSADEDAERAMRAYLETFACDFGQGRNIKGGQREIELPGATQLFDLVNEYKALAADLAARKEALNVRPGIESEVILDKSEAGLYDNIGVGITGGAYTSVSRALQDPTGQDAEAWEKQKTDTASKVKTGTITAAAGAVGGAIGNLAINTGKNKPKEESDKIIKEYDKKKRPATKEATGGERRSKTASNNTKRTKTNTKDSKGQQLRSPCSAFDGTSGQGDYPDCECASEDDIFSTAVSKCIPKNLSSRNSAYNDDGTCKLTGVVAPDECKCGKDARREGDICVCDEIAGCHPSPQKQYCQCNGEV